MCRTNCLSSIERIDFAEVPQMSKSPFHLDETKTCYAFTTCSRYTLSSGKALSNCLTRRSEKNPQIFGTFPYLQRNT